MNRQELFDKYKASLSSPMDESLNGFCDWLISEMNDAIGDAVFEALNPEDHAAWCNVNLSCNCQA